ncbi:MAG: 3-dehydroquinate synthase [Gemmatimonadota bacterium]
MTVPEELRVRAGAGTRDYPVLLGAGARLSLGGVTADWAPSVRRWAVVTDDRVGPLYVEEVEAGIQATVPSGPRVIIPEGEGEKTRARWGWVTDRLLESGLGRDGGIIALGGGVVGDLAGFVGATYMRGIPVVQVPTSLLAMIDASVGGKTGVDTPAGKNLVGAFHPPAAVVVDPEVIGSLPVAQRRYGLAEALKHGAILDAAYGQEIADSAPALLAAEPGPLLRVVRRSVQLKSRVVSQDEKEAGLREILNFGHTVAHALEHASDYSIPHGAAVAMGMVWEARIGEGEGVTRPGTSERLAEWLAAVGLPTDPPVVDRERFVKGLGRDKKVRSGMPRLVLLDRCGQVAPSSDGSWARAVPVERIVARGPWS